MFWKKNAPRADIIWKLHPGCFERHLQRRHSNPLFSQTRQQVTSDELQQARSKDDFDMKECVKKYGIHHVSSRGLHDNSPIADVLQCLKDTQDLLSLVASVGGDLTTEAAVLEQLESSLESRLKSDLSEGHKLLESTHSLSFVERIPLFAQIKRPDTPIMENEILPSLVTDGDMETIRLFGLLSRTFPDFKPSTSEMEKFLENHIKQGLDASHAKEILEEWCRLPPGSINPDAPS